MIVLGLNGNNNSTYHLNGKRYQFMVQDGYEFPVCYFNDFGTAMKIAQKDKRIKVLGDDKRRTSKRSPSKNAADG